MGWCLSSPVFRELSLRIVERLAAHVAGQPAVRMWHVSNEFDGGNARCHRPVSADTFRRWVQDRCTTVDAVNEAWGLAFWGNTDSSFEEIVTPGGSTTHNPGQLLDYERFAPDALLEQELAFSADRMRWMSDGGPWLRPAGVDLLTGNRHDGEVRLAAGAVVVIREDRD